MEDILSQRQVSNRAISLSSIELSECISSYHENTDNDVDDAQTKIKLKAKQALIHKLDLHLLPILSYVF